MSIIHKLVNTGIHEALETDVVSRTRLLNRLLVLIYGMCLIVIFLYFFTSFVPWEMAILIAITFSSYLIPLFLNRIGSHISARIAFIVLVFIITSLSTILFGPRLHIQYYLMPLIGVPLVLLGQEIKNWIWLLVLLPFPVGLYLEFHSTQFDPVIGVSEDFTWWFRILNDVFVATVIGSLFWTFVRESEAKEKTIKKKNLSLKVLNNEVTAGHRYAKQILQAMEPAEEFQKTFPSSYIFNEPKDIIGGDFYMIEKKENKVYIIVADCTGHGVPGALISISINSILRQVFDQGNLKNTAEILKELNLKVNAIYKRKKGYSNEGCDISICKIDLESKKIQFSGARSDLFIMTESKMKRYRGDKISIGGMLTSRKKEITFSEVEIDIEDSDLLILTTDGITDQVNALDQVFDFQGLESLGEEMSKTDGSEWSKVMQQRFGEWNGDADQLDDCLALFFKLS